MPTATRRRVVRPTLTAPSTLRQAQRLRSQLAEDETAFARWFRRLQRASRALEKLHTRQQRLQRRLRLLETHHVPNN